MRIVVKQVYEQERGTALKPFPIDWHLVGVPLPTFLLARWACSSTFSTSNATLYKAIIVHLSENIQSTGEAIQNRALPGIQTPRAVLEWSKQVKRLVSVCTL